MSFETVQNFYERRVYERLTILGRKRPELDEETLADAACLALNRLPPRYVRHVVDAEFFLSIDDMEEIDRRVNEAVDAALVIVTQER